MWLLRGPVTIHFRHENTKLTVKATEENGILAIHWLDEIYADRDDFYAKAMWVNQRQMSIYDELYDFKLIAISN